MDQQKIDQSISWIKYGQFGREEGALIIGTICMNGIVCNNSFIFFYYC